MTPNKAQNVDHTSLLMERHIYAPFNYSLMASGCVVTVVLIEAEPGAILTVINDGGWGWCPEDDAARFWQAWSTRQITK